MAIHPLAGHAAPASALVDVPKLLASYYADTPDPTVREQRVAFGTSGRRGASFKRSFNEHHILATTQPISEYRQTQGTDGPLHLGIDTQALWQPGLVAARPVLPAD